MEDWQPTAAYRKIAEANREYYAATAATYDRTENCVVDPSAQAQLERDLDGVLAHLRKPPSEVTALDACGGSGNVALKLLHRGVQVTLADISPDLIAIFQTKAAAAGKVGRAVCGEIATFLAQEGPSFDLIVFSSALHHLADIDAVLELAWGRLSAGGLLFTVHDPTAREHWSPATRLATRLGYYWFKLSRQRSDLLPALGRKLRRLAARSSPRQKDHVPLNSATAGMLAEYHVERGIDDGALVARLRDLGYDVLWHERSAESRSPALQWLIETLGDATSFKLLLRRPG